MIHYANITDMVNGPTGPNDPSLHVEKPKVIYNNITNMNDTLCTFFLDAIDLAYKKTSWKRYDWTYQSTLLDAIQHVSTKYGRITPMDLENNLQQMKKDWDPNTPIKDLFAQINDTSEYIISTEHPYTDAALVNYGESVILCTNHFATQYGEWRKGYVSQWTWAVFATWWQNEYDLKQETTTTNTNTNIHGIFYPPLK